MLAWLAAVAPSPSPESGGVVKALHLDDVPMAIWGFIVACLVVTVALHVVRSRLGHQGWRDFLGISEAFVVLTLLMMLMIFGEHALG